MGSTSPPDVEGPDLHDLLDAASDEGPEGLDGAEEPVVIEHTPELHNWIRWRRRVARTPEGRRVFLSLLASCGAEFAPWQVRASVASRSHKGWVQKAAVGGMGSGKTTWAAGTEMPICVLANPGGDFLIAAPTYDQLRHVCVPAWETGIQRLQRHGKRISKKGVSPTSMIDELVCGGRVFFRSYTKIGNLLGFEFAGILPDELDTIARPADALDPLRTRLRQKKGPWGDHAFRQLTVSTTPRGMVGAVAQWSGARREAATEAERDAWYWIRATYKDNPFLVDGYGDMLRRGMSARRYRQEVEAEILTPDAVVLSEYTQRHVVQWRSTRSRFDPDLPWWLAWDGGDSRPHILAIQLTPSGAVIVDEIADDMGRDAQRAAIMDMAGHAGKNPAGVALDRAVKTDRGWVRAALGVEPAWCVSWREQNVHVGLEDLRALLDPADGSAPKLFVAHYLAHDPGERGIHRCLRHYVYRQAADGRLLSDPYKDNVHDHGVDALRYWAVKIGLDGGSRGVGVRRGGPTGGARTMIG